MTTKKFRCRDCGKSRVGRSMYVAQDERGGYYCNRKRVICAGKPKIVALTHILMEGGDGAVAGCAGRAVPDMDILDRARDGESFAAAYRRLHGERACVDCAYHAHPYGADGAEVGFEQWRIERWDTPAELQIETIAVSAEDSKFIEGVKGRDASAHNGRRSSVKVRVTAIQGDGRRIALVQQGHMLNTGPWHARGGVHCVCGEWAYGEYKDINQIPPVHLAHINAWRREADRAFPRCRWCGMRGCEKLACEESTTGKTPELVMHARHATFSL